MAGALIVTAQLDEVSQARFDAERARYVPAARNFLPAHVTLFHALSAGEQGSVMDTLSAVCRAEAPSAFATRGLRFLGSGVAYDLDMPAVVALRAELAAAWGAWLTPQDKQKFQPHITVQNKVAPEEARALLERLQAAYAPWSGQVNGLALWRYENGPWANIARIGFGVAGAGGA